MPFTKTFDFSSLRDLRASVVKLPRSAKELKVEARQTKHYLGTMETITFSLKLPSDLSHFRLPLGVKARLQNLLDRQDQGIKLTSAERAEAEGLVDLAESLTLLKLRASRPKVKVVP